MIEVVTKANRALNAHDLLTIGNYYTHEKTLADLKKKFKEAKKGDDSQKIAKATYDSYKERNLMPDQEPKQDKLKMIEMQLNKHQSMLERAKMVILRLDKIILAVPYTISRIEVRARSALVNQRSVLDGIAHFLQFYLINLNYQNTLMKAYKEHLEEIERQAYESRY